MSREMFRSCGDARSLQAANHGCGQTCGKFRIFTERPRSDNRITRIVIHIADRSEIHTDSKFREFLAQGATDAVGQRLRTNRAQGHVPGERSTVSHGHELAAFLVGGDEKRRNTCFPGFRLQSMSETAYPAKIADVFVPEKN